MSTDQVELNDATTGAVGSPTAADPSASRRPIQVVLERDGQESRYDMFPSHRITAEGAFLAGTLFLELGEDVELALPIGDTDTLRLRARVVGLDLGATPGMHVHFAALDPDTETRIREHFSPGRSSPNEES